MEAGPSHRRSLDVYLREELIGQLDNRGGGRLRFRYAPEAIERHGEGTYLLSLSLPVGPEAIGNARCKPYFDGLLPEGSARDVIARSVGASPDNTYSLLEALGGDCAGAVVLLPEGARTADVPEPVRWLASGELRAALENLDRAPLGLEPGGATRLSLAGVQPKLVAIRDATGRFGLPRGDTPSNVILKPAHDPSFGDLVTNEAYCLSVARSSRARTVEARVERIAGLDTLVVERFDRSLDGNGGIVRVHQEDFCQALGFLPAEKYEHEGGPAFADLVAAVRALRTPGLAGAEGKLWHALILQFLLGNAGAHAKNYSIVSYERELDGRLIIDVSLAPLYDVVSTAIYPGLSLELAMSIGGSVDPDGITLESFREEARRSGLGEAEAVQLVGAIGATIVRCARANAGLSRLEGWHRDCVDEILAICEARAEQIGIAV